MLFDACCCCCCCCCCWGCSRFQAATFSTVKAPQRGRRGALFVACRARNTSNQLVRSTLLLICSSTAAVFTIAPSSTMCRLASSPVRHTTPVYMYCPWSAINSVTSFSPDSAHTRPSMSSCNVNMRRCSSDSVHLVSASLRQVSVGCSRSSHHMSAGRYQDRCMLVECALLRCWYSMSLKRRVTAGSMLRSLCTAIASGVLKSFDDNNVTFAA